MGPSTRPIMQQGVIPYMAKLIAEDPNSILLIQPKRQPEKKQQESKKRKMSEKKEVPKGPDDDMALPVGQGS